jgi:hypothetical protein
LLWVFVDNDGEGNELLIKIALLLLDGRSRN